MKSTFLRYCVCLIVCTLGCSDDQTQGGSSIVGGTAGLINNGGSAAVSGNGNGGANPGQAATPGQPQTGMGGAVGNTAGTPGSGGITGLSGNLGSAGNTGSMNMGGTTGNTNNNAGNSGTPVGGGGTSDCGEFVACLVECDREDEMCQTECVEDTSEQGLSDYNRFISCAESNGCLEAMTDMEFSLCIQQNCALEGAACAPSAAPEGGAGGAAGGETGGQAGGPAVSDPNDANDAGNQAGNEAGSQAGSEAGNEAGNQAGSDANDVVPAPCGENEYVSSNTCTPCAPGTRNAAGDDANGVDTSCDPIRCAANEFVTFNRCKPCPEGQTNEAGDLASGADTACNMPAAGDIVLCTDTCRLPNGVSLASDGICDDGGPNAVYDLCPLGTDCADCGNRMTDMAPEAQPCGGGEACTGNDICIDGECVCIPDCSGRQCGDDGCGNRCGDCALGNAEYTVTVAGGLQPQQSFTNQTSLLPDRAGTQEWIEVGKVTVGQCVPFCRPGQLCGDDGCGGECGDGCGNGEACTEQGICVGSGDVRVTLSWETDADLDIYVTAPNGDVIYYSDREGGQGGELDADAHAGCGRGQAEEPGIENIFWANDTAPEGTYSVMVEQWSRCDESTTPFTVTIVSNGVTETFEGVFDNAADREEREITTFEVTDTTCVPSCDAAACGSDGCGGSCGTCAQGQQCLSGICAGLGDLAVSLQWNTEHDLDLKVVAPNGEELWWRNDGPLESIGGGELDVDSHANCRETQDAEGNATPGVENIFWPAGGAPDGEYTIFVSNWSDCEYVPRALMCNEETFVCE